MSRQVRLWYPTLRGRAPLPVGRDDILDEGVGGADLHVQSVLGRYAGDARFDFTDDEDGAALLDLVDDLSDRAGS